jgi:signal transduction histidine kinase
MNASPRRVAARYAIAVASSLGAFALALTLEHPWVTLSPFFLFYAAVAVSSWYGGTGPGICATVIGALAVDYYILEPRDSFRIANPQDLPRLVLFTSVGLLIAFLNGALRRAQYRSDVEAAAARKSEAEVQQHQERLQVMASELMMAEERERRRIASVLHDAVVQTLALSKLKVDTLRRATSDGVHDRLTEIYGLIDESISRTRTLSADLSPPVLYELGLPAAVQWLGDRLRDEHGISFELTTPKEWTSVNDETRVVLFQAVRELLINVAKHARATRCRVRISRDESNIRIEVDDNGVGTVPLASTNYGRGGLGLFNIRQRLQYLGGGLAMDARPGEGTTVVLIAPVRTEARKE